MARCGNCDAELQPGWKFCIRCGTPVDPARERYTAVPPTFGPDLEAEPGVRRRLDVPLILGVALGIGGLILIGYLVIVLAGRT